MIAKPLLSVTNDCNIGFFFLRQ